MLRGQGVQAHKSRPGAQLEPRAAPIPIKGLWDCKKRRWREVDMGELWLRYKGLGWGKGPGAAERQELQTGA